METFQKKSLMEMLSDEPLVEVKNSSDQMAIEKKDEPPKEGFD